MCNTELSLDFLVENGVCTLETAACLKKAVKDRKNILITGAIRTGKTTLLTVLSADFGPDETVLRFGDASDTVTVSQAVAMGLLKHEKLDRYVMDEVNSIDKLIVLSELMDLGNCVMFATHYTLENLPAEGNVLQTLKDGIVVRASTYMGKIHIELIDGWNK